MTRARLAGLIEHLPEGLSEIYMHPATGPYPGLSAWLPVWRGTGGTDRSGAAARLVANGIKTGGFADFPTQ